MKLLLRLPLICILLSGIESLGITNTFFSGII